MCVSQERGCAETRVAATQLLSAIARSSGAALWRDGGFYWEEALRICNAGLSDPVQVRVTHTHTYTRHKHTQTQTQKERRTCAGALVKKKGMQVCVCVRVCVCVCPMQAVRDGHAMGLCDLAVSVRLPGIDAAIRDSTRPNAKEALQRLKAEDGAVAYRTAVLQVRHICARRMLHGTAG